MANGIFVAIFLAIVAIAAPAGADCLCTELDGDCGFDGEFLESDFRGLITTQDSDGHFELAEAGDQDVALPDPDAALPENP